MKSFLAVAAVLGLAAGMAVAQTTAPAAPSSAPQATQAPASPGPATQQPNQPPAANQPSAQGAQPAAQPAQPAGRKQPQAKTQEEYKAYQEAGAKTDLSQAESAADAFAEKFPQSDLRVFLYRRLMYLYQSANNADKTLDMAKKMLAVDPNNPEALVTAAMVLSERTRETDLDRDQRLAEATKYANQALQSVETDLFVPANADPAQVQNVKNVLRGMADLALGTVEYLKKNYTGAQPYLEQATQLNPKDPVSWLRLAVVLDQQNKYPDAMTAANKAVEVAPANSPEAEMAKSEQARLQKLVPGGSATPPKQ